MSSERSKQGTPVARTSGPGQHERLIGICAYLVLFLFGLLQGVIGCFQYSRGPAPLAAAGFDLAILATCLLSGWGMRAAAGGLMPGVGWFVAAFILATTGTQGGSVLITNTTAGQWFLFGGAACAAAGCLLSYVVWSRPGRGSRMPRRAGR